MSMGRNVFSAIGSKIIQPLTNMAESYNAIYETRYVYILLVFFE